jgi:hypothetical protein
MIKGKVSETYSGRGFGDDAIHKHIGKVHVNPLKKRQGHKHQRGPALDKRISGGRVSGEKEKRKKERKINEIGVFPFCGSMK